MSLRVTWGALSLLRIENAMCSPEAKCVGCDFHVSHSCDVAHPAAADTAASAMNHNPYLFIDPSLDGCGPRCMSEQLRRSPADARPGAATVRRERVRAPVRVTDVGARRPGRLPCQGDPPRQEFACPGAHRVRAVDFGSVSARTIRGRGDPVDADVHAGGKPAREGA